MNSLALEQKVRRKVENGRLVYYKRTADAAYWDEHWEELITPEFYDSALKGHLGNLEKVFSRYLPKGERILEAGCGPGQWVLALRQRGYEVEGVDFGRQTIEKVRRIFPYLPVRVGDVCALDVEDGFYGGYISLGVVEHRRDGPEPFLAEAFRVLKPGGVGILTVPWFNPLRRMKSWSGAFRRSDTRGMEFYQYAFNVGEMKDYLAGAKFQIVETLSSHNIKDGFEDELPFLNGIYQRGTIGKIVKRLVRNSRLIAALFGHMRVYVCRRP